MNDIFEKYRQSLRDILDTYFINPILFILIKLKLTPNLITLIGFAICIVAD